MEQWSGRASTLLPINPPTFRKVHPRPVGVLLSYVHPTRLAARRPAFLNVDSAPPGLVRALGLLPLSFVLRPSAWVMATQMTQMRA